MADQKEWAKLWFSALSDEDVLALPPAKRWAWAALMTYTKKHGTNGVVMIRPDSDFLAVALGVPKEQLLSTIKCLPHVQIGDSQSEHGMVACSFLNWYKYQVDSTHAERQKRARYKRREEEEKNKTKKRVSPPTPPGDTSAQTPASAIFEIYQAQRGCLPEARITESRKRQAALRLRNPNFLADFEATLKRANATPFLCGSGDRGWKPGLDWFLVNDKNIYRVLEGQFDGQKQAGKSTGQRTLENIQRLHENDV